MTARVDPERVLREWHGLQDDLARAWRQAADLQPVPVGVTPREPVLETDGGVLYRYGNPAGAPVLLVYSLVNRAYLLDLQERRSVVRRLQESGFTVYLIDWDAPGPMDRFRSLEDYIEGTLDDAVRAVSAAHGGNGVHLLGVCQGGTLSLCYAALHPEAVRSMVTLVTPVDFQTAEDVLYHLARHVDFESVVRASGNVRSVGLNMVFAGLKPFQLFVQRYLGMADLADKPEAMADFLRMERWMYDSPDQAGTAFLQFARDFYQRNGLVNGTVVLGGRRVDLGAVKMPVCNIYATGDHLVPAEAACALGPLVGTEDYTAREMPGGHLGVFISGHAHRELYPWLAQWLHDRS